MREDHCVYIGEKPFMNYVTAIVMQFTTKNADSVIVRARGKFISRAVDVIEVVTKRFLMDHVIVDRITTNSEHFTNKEGKNVTVSTIDIMLKRKERA